MRVCSFRNWCFGANVIDLLRVGMGRVYGSAVNGTVDTLRVSSSKLQSNRTLEKALEFRLRRLVPARPDPLLASLLIGRLVRLLSSSTNVFQTKSQIEGHAA
jgi:hypothetical protein